MDTAKWKTPPAPIPESEILETYESDVVVVGAGHSGVAAARACAEGGLRVRVIETMIEDRYFAYGVDFGHINSEFLKSNGVPEVDEIEFFNDWQLRSGNRSNPRLVMQFARNCGACFDWFYDALTPEQKKNVRIRYWPAPTKFAGSLNGIKTWVGTATFPEALWENRGISPAVVSNIRRAKEEGAQFHFSTIAEQLEKENGRVVSVIARERNRGYVRFRAKKAVVLAAGDFAQNGEMVRDLCDEIVSLYSRDTRFGGFMGRDGSGIRMGLWAGGRMVPSPLASMGGNGVGIDSPLGVVATLWLNGENERFCNEGFGGGEIAGIEAARQKPGVFVTVFDDKIDDLMQRQAPCHGCRWVSNPEDPLMASTRKQIQGARAAGAEGYTDPDSPFKQMKGPRLYAADTLEELADYLGYSGYLKENFLRSIARYNELCAKGRDEDFGKDPSLLVPIDTPPFYGIQTDRQRVPMMMVTLDGLWTDEHQQVLDDDLNPIDGLYATGNCCGRRFGLQYSTPVSGVSIGIAWTLGRELGRHLSGQI